MLNRTTCLSGFTRLLVATIFAVTPFATMADILLYGGKNNREFIGCYNCSKYDSDSICNKYGSFGSKYSSDSIWNKYGTYGSKYSSSSPWNKYSSSNDVPILVDDNGNFYGYYTINVYRSKAFNQSKDLKKLYETLDGDLEAVRNIICS